MLGDGLREAMLRARIASVIRDMHLAASMGKPVEAHSVRGWMQRLTAAIREEPEPL